MIHRNGDVELEHRPASPCRDAGLPRRVLAVLAAMALVVAGCSGGDGLGDDAARMSAGGTLEIADEDGWSPAVVGDVIPDGARVRTGEAETRLELRDGEVWLAPHSMAVVTAELVDVIRGELLVSSGGALAARWGEVEVDGRGVFRLTPGAAPVVRVYAGEGEVRRPGEGRTVGRLRQVQLASSRLPPRATPLQYDTDDAWDRALLPVAVAFDEEISRISRGIDRQHGVEPQDAAFYETFAAVDEAILPILASLSRVVVEDRFGPPSDALVTLFVAGAMADDGGFDLASAARRVSELRVAGARWGLLALEYDITTTELARAVDLGQERRLATVGPEVTFPAAPTGDVASSLTAASAEGAAGSTAAGTPAGGPASGGVESAPAVSAPTSEPERPSSEPPPPASLPLPPAPVPVPGPPAPAPAPEPSVPVGREAIGAVGAVLGDVIEAAEPLLP